MKAWVLHDIGDFRLEDVAEPVIGEDEVLVQVKAAGICGSDIPRVFQTGAHRHPLVIGHEFSGVVTETGAKVSGDWKGKPVGVFPLIPCGQCLPCQRKLYEMCRNYGYLGSRRDGGFAEYVAVPAANLLELPKTVTFEEAAMLEPMAVAVHAMRRLSFSGTDTVAVCGLGTIGLLLVMFLKEAGVENILAIGNKEFQKQAILGLGLSQEQFFDSRKPDMREKFLAATGGAGADVYFECVGKNATFAQAVEDTAAAGRICLVGNPYSDMALDKQTYWKILRNQLTVTGTWNSSFTQDPGDDWHYVLKCLAHEKITPSGLISHRLSLEELGKGFGIMRDKTEDYIKIMVRLNSCNSSDRSAHSLR